MVDNVRIEREKEKRIKTDKEKQVIHVNLVSQTEMKAHTETMRDEMDRKIVRCLMVMGLDTREAFRRVKIWNAEWDSEKLEN